MTSTARARVSMLLVSAVMVVGLRGQEVSGDWQGTLGAAPNSLRLLFHIVRAQDGTYSGQLDSLDQGTRIPIDLVQINGNSVRFDLKAVKGTFTGTLESDGSIKGTWSQGTPLPLVLTRVAPGTAAAAAKTPAPGRVEAVLKDFGVPFDIEVPTEPVAFRGHGGAIDMAYEIHLTNAFPAELHVSRIEVLDGDTVLEAYEGPELNAMLQLLGRDAPDKRTLGPGLRAVAFVWIRLKAGAAAPKSLRNRITVDDVPLERTVAVSAAPVVLGPPLAGSNWVAANGPANTSGHRRALMPVGGKLHIAQRFAIDWVKVDDKGRTFDGDSKDNTRYYAYGVSALAVANATVSSVRDGIPENVPGPNSRAVPITLDTIGGNHVVLDLGGGRFAFYAHLQPGSLKVKPGDKVTRGQALGLVGNSGNSTEPHLHFHVTDGPSPMGSEGVPYVLDAFEVLGATAAGPKTNSLPLESARIAFPAVR